MAVSKQQDTLFPGWLILCTEQQNYAYSCSLHVVVEDRGRGMCYVRAYNIFVERVAIMIYVMHKEPYMYSAYSLIYYAYIALGITMTMQGDTWNPGKAHEWLSPSNGIPYFRVPDTL